MLTRLTVAVAALGASAATLVTASPAAAAPLCYALPVATIGFTAGVAGETVRVPAVTDVNVCLWSEGSYGAIVPDVSQPEGCGSPCVRVAVDHWRNTWNVGVTYYADGDYRGFRTEHPPVETGPNEAVCLLSIGSPADTTCLTFLNIG